MKLYFIDLFCGAGGVTTGLHNAVVGGENIAEVIACVNHDAKAIKSHYMNHPFTKHFTEDIRTLDISEIIALVNAIRRKHPDAVICLWASLECTNFSKAKGGQPRNADSRTLAEHLYRYIDGFNPDYIFIENVEEFMSWGPLNEKGKPVSRDAGRDYLKWIYHVQDYGYKYDHRILNSADYGAYTSRKRYFGLFAKPHLPIIFPAATHSKNPEKSMFGAMMGKWKPVKEVLDFTDEGNSIFERIKDLSEKTLQRILAGLIKYVAGGKEAFMIKYLSNNAVTGINAGASIDEPCHTITTQNRLGIVTTKSAFIQKYFSGRPEGKVISVEQPAGTITTFGGQSLVQAKFMVQRNSGIPESKIPSVENPARTLTATGGNLSLVSPEFIAKYYGHGDNVHSVDSPAGTITTKDRMAFVQPKYWLDKQYSGAANHQSTDQPAGSILSNDKHCLMKAEYFIDRPFSQGSKSSSIEMPAGSIMTVPKLNLVSCKWVMNTNFNNVGSSIEDPAPTITANRKHHYIMNPSWGGNNSGIDGPCCTIVARQDKAPLGLISTAGGDVAIAVYESDSETMVKIKEFMVLYGIVDIKMRMLKVPELLKIQGFPDGYILEGNQADQKKFIGNSVVPLIPERWVQSIYEEICEARKAA